ncbi:Twitching motility protein PilT [Acidisarcina polymorpha]|uniref:Twitching motility protein PilT n=1 Tax=Acidisarcina polymorpha TaxID=2211140 RepID=A0A2Z5G758_9BACT|nr:PilT/PilU family type 4a pilus ATPase [Acidisarcina polymorpha]AXC14819.1 Twitching motility protein PilT [Acidisarcina polymorpha]
MSAYESELSRLVDELNRSVPGVRSGERTSLDQLLALAAQRNASDMILVVGSAIALRVNGGLSAAAGKPLTHEDIRGMLLPLLTTDQSEELQRERSLDFCFVRNSIGRFRANFHYQRGTLAASIRLLPPQVPSLESLHLPSVLAPLTERRQGLILLTGPTGCGKTSTLAALIDLINGRRRDHIITIEDPIEYQHMNRGSIVEQIEVGHDTPSFAQSIRAVLRQSPDVILVGEMRDAETMAVALTAAETGHLVLSSLHTNDAAQTVSRILDTFPSSHQPQIRQQLSLALLAVISQQLVPAADGSGRYPAIEVMLATTAIRNLIRTGQDHQIRSHISVGRADGMFTMEQSLAELVRAGRILRETAYAHCYNQAELRQHLDTPSRHS